MNGSLKCIVTILILGASTALAQESQHALRFYGTGVGPPGQQDRVLIAQDDNAAGPDASQPSDIGNGDFTIEFWLRGTLIDNQAAATAGDVERFDYAWIEGNIIVDRDIWCSSGRKYGISLRGGLVSFGTSFGDGADSEHTMEGSQNVLDNQWHHVTVVRNAGTGYKRIYVDGVLDFESSAGVSMADLSYPNDGIPVTGNCNTGQLTPYGWFLVLAAEKHDAGAAYPSFAGYMDELRLWSVARTAQQIANSYNQLVASNETGLVGWYRFEEGSGTVIADSSDAGSASGTLIAGTSGNGEWVSRSADPMNTAPIGNSVFADGFESP